MSQQVTPAQYIQRGQAPFFRLPEVPASAGPHRFRGAKAVLLGAPWDGGTSFRPGARFGPWEARAASVALGPYHPTHRLDVFELTHAVDGGNAATDAFSWERTEAAVRGLVAEVASSGAAPFLVGGDHSLALPAMRALAAVHGPLCVIHLDAHFDTGSEDAQGGLSFHHGTPLGHAIREGLLDQEGLLQVGVRAPWGSLFDAAPSRQVGARQFSVDEVVNRGPAVLGAELCALTRGRPTYVTLDVDVLDPAFAPGTGTPVPGGLSTRELIALLRALAGVHLVGMDVVELCPAHDVSGITALATAHLLYEGVALKAVELANAQVAAAAPTARKGRSRARVR